MPARVTLLTDFGTADGYVGALKGVISAAAPGVFVDDVSHELPRGDVRTGMYALGRYWRLYPPGTVHLAVVDPGVGTSRRALACEADARFFVAPDNGLLSRVLAQAASWRAVELAEVALPESVTTGRSSTFHGRDVFAPAAAVLALGRPMDTLGAGIPDPVRVHEPVASRDGSAGTGIVVAVDHFGNLLTNLPGAWLASGVVDVAGKSARAVTTYGDAAPGDLVALIGSDGRVEVAVRDGSAAHVLRAGPGAEVRILFRSL